MSQWVPTHYETYKTAYRALVAKSLIQDVDAQFFRLTDAGLWSPASEVARFALAPVTL